MNIVEVRLGELMVPYALETMSSSVLSSKCHFSSLGTGKQIPDSRSILKFVSNTEYLSQDTSILP